MRNRLLFCFIGLLVFIAAGAVAQTIFTIKDPITITLYTNGLSDVTHTEADGTVATLCTQCDQDDVVYWVKKTLKANGAKH